MTWRLATIWLLVTACEGRATDADANPSENETSADNTLPACAAIDADADGHDSCTDCDDADALVFPGAAERCNGLDDDCDGAPAAEEADVATCADCDAAGFWSDTLGLSGTDLTAELAALTLRQTCTNYSETTTHMFVFLDKEAGEVECVYTGRHTAVGIDKPDATDMNTEHTWPQSLGADVPPAKCDLHHLYPTDADANNRRSSYPFGLVTGSIDWQEGGSKLGNGAGGTVFEPRDAHKGNVARSMIYFSVRYGYPLDADQLSLFRQWHAADPVDAAELERTWAIADYQEIANPFVVCPELVDAL